MQRLRSRLRGRSRWAVPLIVVPLIVGGASVTIASVASTLDLGATSQVLGDRYVEFGPKVVFDEARLVVAGPDGRIIERTFVRGDLLRLETKDLADGVFRFELELARKPPEDAFRTLSTADENGRTRVLAAPGPFADRIAGTFGVKDGKVVQPAEEGGGR